MGAPNKPGFAPDDSSVVFLQSSGGSLAQQLWALDIASGELSELAKPPEGVGEEETLSLEEKLRRERARQLHTGITSFAWAAETDSLLCPVGNDLFVMEGVGKPLTKLFDSAMLPGPALDARISSDGTLVAFVCEKELYFCASSASGDGSAPKQLTDSARGTALTNGLADFIAMEEMDRMEGFWISPDSQFIAFEQSDESHIPPYRIMHQGSPTPSTQEDHHYPFAGAPNPKVGLGIVEVATSTVVWLDLKSPFGDDFYLARVQWAAGEYRGKHARTHAVSQYVYTGIQED
jgi:dipeptidyl-peptidase-4